MRLYLIISWADTKFDQINTYKFSQTINKSVLPSHEVNVYHLKRRFIFYTSWDDGQSSQTTYTNRLMQWSIFVSWDGGIFISQDNYRLSHGMIFTDRYIGWKYIISRAHKLWDDIVSSYEMVTNRYFKNFSIIS